MKRSTVKEVEAKKEVVAEEVKAEEKPKMVEAFAVWRHKSKAGNKYLSGVTKEAEGEPSFKIVGFYNGKKKNPKEPDIRFYELLDDGKRGEEICSLWEYVSKKGVSYLSGLTADKKRIVAYYRKEQDNTSKPYIRAYYTE